MMNYVTGSGRVFQRRSNSSRETERLDMNHMNHTNQLLQSHSAGLSSVTPTFIFVARFQTSVLLFFTSLLTQLMTASWRRSKWSSSQSVNFRRENKITSECGSRLASSEGTSSQPVRAHGHTHPLTPPPSHSFTLPLHRPDTFFTLLIFHPVTLSSSSSFIQSLTFSSSHCFTQSLHRPLTP